MLQLPLTWRRQPLRWRGRSSWPSLLLFIVACSHPAPPTVTPAVAASRVGGAEWSKVVIVPAKPTAIVGDTVHFSAGTIRGDVEGEHYISCGAAWRSFNPERARFLHDGPDGRLIALAPGSATITATCGSIQAAVTLDISGKP